MTECSECTGVFQDGEDVFAVTPGKYIAARDVIRQSPGAYLFCAACMVGPVGVHGLRDKLRLVLEDIELSIRGEVPDAD